MAAASVCAIRSEHFSEWFFRLPAGWILRNRVLDEAFKSIGELLGIALGKGINQCLIDTPGGIAAGWHVPVDKLGEGSPVERACLVSLPLLRF